MGKITLLLCLSATILVSSGLCSKPKPAVKGVWSSEGCIVPVEDPEKQGRHLWGVLDIWQGSDDNINPPTLASLCDTPCGCYNGPNPPLVFPIGGNGQQIGNYPIVSPGSGTILQPNQFGGFEGGNLNNGVFPNQPNQYGGYIGNSLNNGIGVNSPDLLQPGSIGSINTGSNYQNSNYDNSHLSVDQTKNTGSQSSGSNYGINGINQPGGYNRPGGLVSANGNNFQNSNYDNSHLSVDQSKNTGSQSSGSNFAQYGANRPGFVSPIVPGVPSYLLGGGSNYQNSNFNKENLNVDQTKQSGSSSSGSNFGTYGANRPTGGARPFIPGQVVSAEGNQYQNSNFNNEQLSIDQTKESGASSSGSNYGVVGLGPIGGPVRPLGSGVVSAGGNQFQNSNFNNEQLSIDQSKESGASSNGNNYGVVGVIGSTRPYGSGVVSSQGNEYENSEFNNEHTSIDQSKLSGASSSGSNYGVVGVGGVRPYGPGAGLVSAGGNQYQNSDYNNEQLSIDQSKQSGASSSGSNYGVVGVGGVRPYGPGAGLVSAGGNQYQNSDYNNEQLSIDQSKQSGASSSGSNYGVVGVGGVRPYGPGAGLVSAGGNQYQNSDYNKETLNVDQSKQSGSSSSGSNYGVVGVGGVRPYGPGAGLVSAGGNQYQNSDFNNEQLSIDQSKVSGASSSGSNYGVVGIERPVISGRPIIGPLGSSVVSTQGNEYENSDFNSEHTSIDQSKQSGSSSSGSNFGTYGANRPTGGARPFIPGQVVSAEGNQYQNSNFNNEQLSIDQSKQSGSSSSGSNYGVVGVGGVRPYGPGVGLVSAGGNQYQNSDYNKETLNVDQSKQSGSSSSGSNYGVVGVGRPIRPLLGPAVVSAGGNQYQNSEFNNEHTSIDQSKASGASSSGSNYGVVGIERPVISGRPIIGPLGSSVVSAQGNEYQNSEFNNEHTSIDQSKASGASSSGSNYGVVGIERPVISGRPIIGPLGSSVVSTQGNEYENSDFNSEHTSIDQSKQSGSSSSGSNFGTVGVNGVVSRPILGGAVVSAQGDEYENSEFNNEHTSIDQSKVSGSSSSGSNYGVLGVNAPVSPIGPLGSSVVSTQGNEFQNSNFDSEHTSIDESKESGSSSSGSNFGVVGVNQNRPLLGSALPLGQVVSSEGSEYQDSNFNNEHTSIDQSKVSGSSSSGSNFGVNEGLVRPIGIGSGVAVSSLGSEYQDSNFDSEHTSIDQSKQSGSSSSGSNFGTVGIVGGSRPFLGGAVVSAEEGQYQNENFNNEHTSIDQSKESGSSSSGSNYGVDVVGQRPYVYDTTGQLLSTGGSQYANSNFNNEHTSLDQSKESGSSSSGSNFDVINAPGIVSLPRPQALVAAQGNQYSNSNFNNEKLNVQQDKQSGSSSSGISSSSLNQGPYLGGNIGGSAAVVSAYENNENSKENTKINSESSSGSSSSGSNFDLVAAGSSPPVTTYICQPCNSNLPLPYAGNSKYNNYNPNYRNTNRQQ